MLCELAQALRAQYPGQPDRQAAALAWIAVYLWAYIYPQFMTARRMMCVHAASKQQQPCGVVLGSAESLQSCRWLLQKPPTMRNSVM
jgi:hypothetical protein